MPSSSVLKNVISPKSSSVAAVPPMPLSTQGAEFPAGNGEEDDVALQLGILVENVPVALAMFDSNMRYLLANRMWIEEFGLQNVKPLVGCSQYEIFPGLHPGWRQVYDRALQGHVVRSEHDAMSGPDGRPIIYRWEVRPWRRRKDASVGGLMVICEKFSSGLAPVSAGAEAALDESPPPAAAASAALFDSSVPVVVLNGEGVIVEANRIAIGASLARGVQEGATFFWNAFGEGRDSASLKQQVLAGIADLNRDGSPGVCTFEIPAPQGGPSGDAEGPRQPSRWMLARALGGDPGSRFLAIGIVTAEVAQDAGERAPVSTVGMASPSPAILQQLQDELARTRQEVSVLREVEQAFAKREHRQKAVLEALPFGLVVLDERGLPIYHNQHLVQMLGRGIHRGESVGQWLMDACPTKEHGDEVSRIWSEHVWRRQLTRVLSLATADGLLKELEFRPATLHGGGMLVCIRDVTESCRIEELLRSTEAKFRTVVSEDPVGIVLVDRGGAAFEINPAAERLLGRSKAELRRLHCDDWLSPESVEARKEALRAMQADGRRSIRLNVRIQRPDGSLRDAILHMAFVLDLDGQPHSTVHFIQDEDESAPAESRSTNHGGASAQAARGDVVRAGAATDAEPPSPGQPQLAVRWLLQSDVNGRITNWSTDAGKLFGYPADEAIGHWLHSLFRPSDATGFYAALRERLGEPGTAFDWSFFGKDGVRGSSRFFVKSAGDGGNSVDLYLQGEGEEGAGQPVAVETLAHCHLVRPSQLWPVADLDREKLLLSETHHRIKNHLQIISSMLNLQLNSLADPNARSALRSSQNRVRSIAALHQHLYQLALGDGSSFEEFAHGLIQRLRECYEVPESQVALDLHIAGGPIHQEWLMPLALILNETLSNAFEHAFPQGRPGRITVRLTSGDEFGEFEVSDDGVGLPDGFDPAIAPGLGLKILGVFAEQMRGELRISGEKDRGTKFNLRFPMAHVDN